MSNKELAQKFLDVLDRDNFDLEYEIRTEYSGRGMFNEYLGRGKVGKTCIGIKTNNKPFKTAVDLCEAVMNDDELTDDDKQEIVEILKNGCMDSMGSGYIYYFPSLSLY